MSSSKFESLKMSGNKLFKEANSEKQKLATRPLIIREC